MYHINRLHTKLLSSRCSIVFTSLDSWHLFDSLSLWNEVSMLKDKAARYERERDGKQEIPARLKA